MTVAEVADAADISVNTVYNYFSTKEDLLLDRADDMRGRLARWVRARDVGESAAAAVLRELRAELEAVSPRVGLMPGFDRFMAVVEAAPTLRLRLLATRYEIRDQLEATLREETGAPAGDPAPNLMAGQLTWLHETLTDFVRSGMAAARPPAEVSREALGLLDDMEDLLSEKVLNYAVRAV